MLSISVKMKIFSNLLEIYIENLDQNARLPCVFNTHTVSKKDVFRKLPVQKIGRRGHGVAGFDLSGCPGCIHALKFVWPTQD